MGTKLDFDNWNHLKAEKYDYKYQANSKIIRRLRGHCITGDESPPRNQTGDGKKGAELY